MRVSPWGLTTRSTGPAGTGLHLASAGGGGPVNLVLLGGTNASGTPRRDLPGVDGKCLCFLCCRALVYLRVPSEAASGGYCLDHPDRWRTACMVDFSRRFTTSCSDRSHDSRRLSNWSR